MRSAETAARHGGSPIAADLRAMVDSLPMPVWRRDRNLRVIDCNAAYRRGTRICRAEAVLAAGAELAPGTNAPDSGARPVAAAGRSKASGCHVVIAALAPIVGTERSTDRSGGRSLCHRLHRS